jgi:molybdopterin/thiamine biosynthesis adenylyltransferase
MSRERYARHLALAEFGAQAQAKLGAARILIVGVGGLGCPAAQYLAGSGAGTLVLNDFDRVDLSNLPRQILFGDDAVGELKAEAAAKALRRLNPEVAVEPLTARLDDIALGAAVADADIVLDCTDNFGTRLAINRACVAAGRPLVSGAALRLEGQLSVFENGPGEPCYRCVYSEDDELLGDCAGNGVLAPVPGVIGCLMAIEAIKLAALGHSDMNGRLLLWDAVSAQWQSLTLVRDPVCPVCADRPVRS